MALPVQGADKWSPEVLWQVKTGGKTTAELQLGANGILYVQMGNKLTAVDENGRKLWEAGNVGGSKTGTAVFDAYGSIFVPGNAFIQEVRLNGGKGWSFAALLGNSKTTAQLTAGPADLLYLSLPSALYALDTKGRYRWMVLEWELGNSTGRGSAGFKEEYNILASAGNEQAVFVVLGRKNGAANLLALSREGEIYWRYSLGAVKSAQLVAGKEGLVYLTVNPNKVEGTKYGTAYAFDTVGSGKPLWSFKLGYNDLTAPTFSEHGLLYFCAGERLYALNQEDGTEAWYQILSEAISRPVADEPSRRVYLGTDDKRLLAVNPQGRLDWQLELDGKVSYQPKLSADGFLYVITDNGVIYKIKDGLSSADGG